MKGIVVNEVSASESVIGTSGTSTNNIKLRRGGNGDLEVVTADESEVEGTPTYTKRTNVMLGSVTVGGAVVPSDNIKLHRGAAGKLEFIDGGDTTPDGTESVASKVDVFSRSISLGDGSNGSGGKIFRSGR